MKVDSELDDYEELLFSYLLCDRKKDDFGFEIRQREIHGAFYTLIQEMQKDREMFFRYYRMTPDRFEHFLSLVKDRLTKKETNLRKPISARERLSVTLRYLAT